MGTKALEEALDNYEEWLHDTRQNRDAVKAASAELEAIRKAAKDLRDTTIMPHGFDSGAYSRALSSALDLLWAIAKEES